ncbi:hypothetical protein LQZ18_08965 [Lachnospiraceae bacterium ZAX-1]
MTDNELLLALSSLFDKKLKPVENRIDSLEERLENRIGGVENRIGSLEERLGNRIGGVENRLKNIELQIENDIKPRLQNIESCYTSTYDRYKNGIFQMEALQTDMDIVKNVVKEHGEKLRKIS